MCLVCLTLQTKEATSLDCSGTWEQMDTCRLLQPAQI